MPSERKVKSVCQVCAFTFFIRCSYPTPKIRPLRVYFSPHVQVRKLLLRESIAVALSATLFFLCSVCSFGSFFFASNSKVDAWWKRKYEHARASVSRVGIANFKEGGRERDERLLSAKAQPNVSK